MRSVIFQSLVAMTVTSVLTHCSTTFDFVVWLPWKLLKIKYENSSWRIRFYYGTASYMLTKL